MALLKRFFLAICLFVFAILQKPAFGQRNILSKAFTQAQVQDKLTNIAAWRLAQKK